MLALTVLVTGLVASCDASGAGSSDPAPDAPATFAGHVPSFTGPYAAEFAEHYAESTSDFVREVLADEVITDAEFAEMTQRFSECLAERGVEFQGYRPGGGYATSIAPQGDTHEIVGECSRSSGEISIGSLRSWMERNPDNLDESSIVAECLVGEQVVAPGYTSADYERDLDGTFGDLASLDPGLRDVLERCLDDPLGTLGG